MPPGPDGKRRPKWFYAKKKSTVVKKLNDAKQHLSEHSDLPTSSITLEKWVAKWLTEIAPKNLNPNTLRSYRSSLTHHVVPRLGKRRLDRLQPGAIREALQQIAEEKSTGTSRRISIWCGRSLRSPGASSRTSSHWLRSWNTRLSARSTQPGVLHAGGQALGPGWDHCSVVEDAG